VELKHKLLNLLELAYEQEQALVVQLSDEERATIGTLERWSAKDLMAHVAAWKERMAQSITAASRGESPPAFGDVDQANAEIFAKHRNRSWAEVLEYSERAYRLLVETVDAVHDDDLVNTQILPWQNGRPLWRLVAGNGYSHPISHLAQYYTDRGEVRYATEISEEAAGLLAQLDDSPGWRGIVRYNLACHYALSGQRERAVDELREALRLNPDLTEWSKEDPDLASIREGLDYQISVKEKTEEVEAYFQALAPERRSALEELRSLILEVAPDVVETMKYRMPTYEYEDVLCSLASQKHYMSLYMDTGIVEKYREKLAGLSVGKSCIRFKRLEDLPLDTIRQMLKESV